MLSIATLSLIICISDGFFGGEGISDCEPQYLNKDPETDEGASWCADEYDGTCSGPGRIYYGAGLTWTYVDLDYGETISCRPSAFGCDGSWLFTFVKKCYKKPLEGYHYVAVNFTEIKILKTNDDGSNGDGVEEWDIYESDPGITMNVDFIDSEETWDGCDFNVDQLNLWFGDENSDCKPPADTENSNGFYECSIAGNPLVTVNALTYVSGLKYTFNFQIGDFDANNEFDDGPIFDFTYTEPDHTSIYELINDGPITRYFTRWDTNKNRRARLWVEYSLLSFDEEVDESGLDVNTCS